MNHQQTAQYNAIQAIRAYLDAHAPIVNGIPAFRAARERLYELADALTEAIVKQDTDSTGVTTDKADARELLARKLLLLSNAAGAIAQASGNDTLKEQVRVTATQLRDMSDDALSGRAQRILDAVRPLKATLPAYGVGTRELEETAALLTAWRSRQGSVREAIAEGSKGTAAIARLLPQLQDHLTETVDRLVAIAGAGDPGFADGYATARALIDPATATRALAVQVRELLHGQAVPVAGATATIRPGNLTKTTGDGGGFYVQSLPPGSYTVVLSKPGYREPDPVPFAVAAGETTALDLTLSKV